VQASELIDAHNNVFTARNELQHNLYQYWSERVNLLQSAGKLDDDAISRISGALSL
jgi:outer membrane protein TolC